MKQRATAVLLAAIVLGVSGGAARSEEKGFTPIFNGSDLSGWTVMGQQAGFEVRDGCIYSDGGKGGNEIRYTARQFGNFVLRMDWMLSKTGNSGIFIRHGISPGAQEIQLLAPWTPYRDDLHCTGSVYGHKAVDNRPDETTLRWRSIEIRAEWKEVTVTIDGKQVTSANYDAVDSMKNLPLVGYIGMQDSHTGPGEWVKFRNIRVKDLDGDPTFLKAAMDSPDASIRHAAYDAAVRLGPVHVPWLLDRLDSDDPAQGHGARLALGRIAGQSAVDGPQAGVVCASLLQRLKDTGKAGTSRACAASLLGICGSGRLVVDALAAAAAEPELVGAAALDSLRRIPGSRATAALIALLRQAAPARQPALLLALGERGDMAAVPVVVSYTEGSSAEVRMAAVRALGGCGCERAVRSLARVAAAGPVEIRRAAVDSLIMIIDSRAVDEPTRLLALREARGLAVTQAQKTAVR